MRRPLCVYCAGVALIMFLLLFALSDALLSEEGERGEGNEGASIPTDGSSVTFVGKILRIDTKETEKEDKVHIRMDTEHGKVLCYFSYAPELEELHMGQFIRVFGKVRYFTPATNPGQFDARLYYRAQGLSYAVSNCELLEAEDIRSMNGYADLLYRIRRRCSAVLSASLPKEEAGILRAMLLGERGGLTDEIKGLFQRNGISHILAISGLHISFFGMGVYGLLRKLRLHRIASGIAALWLVVSFGMMTGQGASTIRSILMFALFLGAEFLGRTYDLQTAMALSAVILICMQPLYVLQSSYQFSFGAIVGISVVLPAIKTYLPKEPLSERMITDRPKKEKMLRRIKQGATDSVWVSLSVTLTVLPVQLSGYSMIPIYSCLLNPPVIALLSIVMSFGVVGVLLGCFWLPLGKVALFPAFLVLRSYEGLCFLFDKLPFANFCLGVPSPLQIVLYYLLLFGWVFASYLRSAPGGMRSDAGRSVLKRRWNLACAFVPVVAVFLLCLRIRTDTVCAMLDVGQGDGLVVEERSGYTFLVDGGSTDVGNVGSYRLIPYLRHEGIRTVDYAFISHADSDHTNGVIELLKDSTSGIRVRHVVLTKFAGAEDVARMDADNPYRDVITAAQEHGAKILYISAGDRFCLGDVTLTCVYPAMEETAEGNDQSMVLYMTVSGGSMLFTGDLTSEKEEEVLRNLPPAAHGIDILKCPHHGSKYSSSSSFLDALHPNLAVISAGHANSYGHPHVETLARFDEGGIPYLTTIDRGCIFLHFKRDGIAVRSYLHGSSLPAAE